MILTPLQKLTKNVEDLGKLIIAKGIKNLPKVKKIAQSGHTDCLTYLTDILAIPLDLSLPHQLPFPSKK